MAGVDWLGKSLRYQITWNEATRSTTSTAR